MSLVLKPASATAGNTQCRYLTAGIDLSGNGTSCMLVDENDELVTDAADLISCRFVEVWLSIYGVYLNPNEVGFTKLIKYLKRASAKVTYKIDNEAANEVADF